MSRSAKARISLASLRRNCAVLRRRAAGSSLLAVLKADAYGHGAVRCAQALASCSDAVAVSTLDEALELRAQGIGGRLLVLHDIDSDARLAQARASALEWVVHDAAQVDLLEQHSGAASGARVWLKIDTGMNRLGVRPEQARPLHARLRALGADIILMTHLSSAAEPDDDASAEQLARFAGIALPGPRSAANSAALLRYPDSHLDWVRPGLALYGVAPGPGPAPGLRPAMRLVAPLLSVRDCPAGARLGYGGAYICPEPMRVGIVHAGYADGYPHAAGNRAEIAIAGRKAAVLGRVSMDLVAVDLRGVPAAPGDPAELWGPAAPIADLAEKSGTIAYELLCRAGGLPHEYEDNENDL